MNKILILENIHKYFQQGQGESIPILNGIDLSIDAGEIIGIIGASGSGKSTLLHIAGLLDIPNIGSVIFPSAKKLKHISKDYLRSRYIGFVYQKHYLLQDFNVIENVMMPRLVLGDSYFNSFNQSREILITLGLDDKIYTMPGKLSGGEQQRVAIARALINNPKIILADEPTGNLDPKTASEVFELFLKIASIKNTSIIMATHNNDIAKKMHKVYVFSNGKIKMQ